MCMGNSHGHGNPKDSGGNIRYIRHFFGQRRKGEIRYWISEARMDNFQVVKKEQNTEQENLC